MFPLVKGGLDQFLKEFNELETLPSAVVCCTEQEPFYVNAEEIDLFQNITAMLNSHNIPLYIILTSSKGNQYDAIKKYNNVHILYWETYWITITARQLNEYPKTINNKFVYAFISMNSFIKEHKCLLMDLLAEKDLINKGAVSWHNLNYKGHNLEYDYRYWTPEVKELSGKFLDIEDLKDLSGNLTEIFNLPIEYNQSFMSLLMESDPRNFAITEKTATPLLTGKPFLVFACRGYHKRLKELGFVLYDEVFDYSFDNKTTLELRGRGIVENIENISKLSQTELEQLTLKLLPKLNFNKELANKIAQDVSRVPNIFLNLINAYPNNTYFNEVKNIYFTKNH